MLIHQKNMSGVVVCSIEGEINIDSVEELKSSFRGFLDKDQKKIIFDFLKVSYIDSLGMASFISFTRKLKEKDGRMVFSNIPPKISSMIQISKLDQALDIFENTDDAISFLKDADEK